MNKQVLPTDSEQGEIVCEIAGDPIAEASELKKETSADQTLPTNDVNDEDQNLNDAPKIDPDKIFEGTCKQFSADRGYGFIELNCDDFTGDVQVHMGNIKGDCDGLQPGQHVKFQIQTRKQRSPIDSDRRSALNVIPGEIPKKPELPKPKIQKGFCVWFDPIKQYGFVKTEDKNSKDIYCRANAIGGGKTLVEGQICHFEIQKSEDGRLQAAKVVAGKLPPVDPELNKIHSGKIGVFFEDKAFGFIIPDKKHNNCDSQLMVHISNVIGSLTTLIAGQTVKYKIGYRRRKLSPDGEKKIEALEVVPGKIPVKEICDGVCKWLSEEKEYGIITRKNARFNRVEYFFYRNNIKINGETGVQTIQDNQPCTFSPYQFSESKQRARDIVPGIMAPTEKTPPSPNIEPYSSKIRAEAESRLPLEIEETKINSMSQESYFDKNPEMFDEQTRKEANWRKKQRKKRSKDRQDSEDDQFVSSFITEKRKTKNKKVEKNSTKTKNGNISLEKIRKIKPPIVETEENISESMFHKRKQQKKKQNAILKKKLIDDDQNLEKIVDDHFKARKKEIELLKLARSNLITGMYYWIRSWCKS